jgi:hypothetical protein
MTKQILIILFFGTMGFLNAQISEQNNEQAKKRMDMMNAVMKLEDQNGWIHKAGVGLDLGQLLNMSAPDRIAWVLVVPLIINSGIKKISLTGPTMCY